MLGSNIQFSKMLFEKHEALMIGRLHEKLVSLVVHDHLESTEVKVALASCKTILKVPRDSDHDVTRLC